MTMNVKNMQKVTAEMIFPATVRMRLWKEKKPVDPDNPQYGRTYYVTLPKEISPVEGEILTLAIIARKPPPESVQVIPKSNNEERATSEMSLQEEEAN